jgi:hypothetical protein
MAFLGPNLGAMKAISDRASKGDRVAGWACMILTIGWGVLLLAEICSLIFGPFW